MRTVKIPVFFLLQQGLDLGNRDQHRLERRKGITLSPRRKRTTTWRRCARLDQPIEAFYINPVAQTIWRQNTAVSSKLTSEWNCSRSLPVASSIIDKILLKIANLVDVECLLKFRRS